MIRPATLQLPIGRLNDRNSTAAKPGWSGVSTTFLDGLRGLAALYVVLHHLRYLLHEGYNRGFARHPEIYSTLDKALFYCLAGFRWGQEAVLFFFILSGFVIHLRYARALQDRPAAATFDWRDYMWRRVRRLYPPLLVALLLTLTLDSWGANQGYRLYLGQTDYPFINVTLTHDTSWTALGANLLFLMPFLWPAFGTNAPLWSLGYEWWFYVLYPALYRLGRKSIWPATVVVVVLCGAAMFIPEQNPLATLDAAARVKYGWWPVVLFAEVLQKMSIWWLGVLLAELYVGRLRFSAARLALVTGVLAGLIAGGSMLLRHAPEHQAMMQGLWYYGASLGFVALISAGFAWQLRGGKLIWLERLQPLGAMSYSLYVTHMPVVALLSAVYMMHHNGDLPHQFSYLGLGLIVCLVIAYLCHLVAERPFTRKSLRH